MFSGVLPGKLPRLLDLRVIPPERKFCNGLQFKEQIHILIFELMGFSLDYIHRTILNAAFSPRTIAHIGKTYVCRRLLSTKA